TVAVSDVAVPADVIEDQVDAGLQRRQRILVVDIEPADFAPGDRLVEALQNGVVDRSRQACCPVVLFEVFGRSRPREQAEHTRAAYRQSRQRRYPGRPHATMLLAWIVP